MIDFEDEEKEDKILVFIFILKRCWNDILKIYFIFIGWYFFNFG